MKIKEGFIVKNVAGSCVAAATGKAYESFNGIITLNETGEFLFTNMLTETTADELVDKMISEFDVDKTTAKKDVDAFVNKLMEAGILE